MFCGDPIKSGTINYRVGKNIFPESKSMISNRFTIRFYIKWKPIENKIYPHTSITTVKVLSC
jgi:hypothetical protein